MHSVPTERNTWFTRIDMKQEQRQTNHQFFSKANLKKKSENSKKTHPPPTLKNQTSAFFWEGEVRLPSTMTGAQLSRLGSRGLHAICSDAATSEALQQALNQQRHKNGAAAVAHRLRIAKMTALGNHKVSGRIWLVVGCLLGWVG